MVAELSCQKAEIVRHASFREEMQQFFVEGLLAMMRLLSGNVSSHSVAIGWANSSGTPFGVRPFHYRFRRSSTTG
jgi:hypothetical protein